MLRNLRDGEEQNRDVGLNRKRSKRETGGEDDNEEKGFGIEEASVERVVVLKEGLLEEREEERRDLRTMCKSEVWILVLILQRVYGFCPNR